MTDQEVRGLVEQITREAEIAEAAGEGSAHEATVALVLRNAAAALEKLVEERIRYKRLNSELCHAHNLLLVDGSRWQSRAESAESRLAAAEEALRELVRLKDLKEQLSSGGCDNWYALNEEYERCKPLAWDRARALAKQGGKDE